MSFVSIRCPNCAGSESLPVGENQYQCKFCDNTFHYANPDTPKVTKNITVQESHHCPICGRGVTAGTSNRCMTCSTEDICSNCISETVAKKIVCKNCLAASSAGECVKCGNYSIFKCYSCEKIHEKDPSRLIIIYCKEHFLPDESMKGLKFFACSNCGMICHNCSVKSNKLSNTRKCKNCGNKLILSQFGGTIFLKNQNKNFVEWCNTHL